jgi:hypothetical protein
MHVPTPLENIKSCNKRESEAQSLSRINKSNSVFSTDMVRDREFQIYEIYKVYCAVAIVECINTNFEYNSCCTNKAW